MPPPPSHSPIPPTFSQDHPVTSDRCTMDDTAAFAPAPPPSVAPPPVPPAPTTSALTPPSARQCEGCTSPHPGTYGSGRFCSATCAKKVGARHKWAARAATLPRTARRPSPGRLTAPDTPCESCRKPHDKSYGSGRFCSVHCARRVAATRKWEKSRTEKTKRLDAIRPATLAPPPNPSPLPPLTGKRRRLVARQFEHLHIAHTAALATPPPAPPPRLHVADPATNSMTSHIITPSAPPTTARPVTPSLPPPMPYPVSLLPTPLPAPGHPALPYAAHLPYAALPVTHSPAPPPPPPTHAVHMSFAYAYPLHAAHHMRAHVVPPTCSPISPSPSPSPDPVLTTSQPVVSVAHMSHVAYAPTQLQQTIPTAPPPPSSAVTGRTVEYGATSPIVVERSTDCASPRPGSVVMDTVTPCSSPPPPETGATTRTERAASASVSASGSTEMGVRVKTVETNTASSQSVVKGECAKATGKATESTASRESEIEEDKGGTIAVATSNGGTGRRSDRPVIENSESAARALLRMRAESSDK